MLFTYEIHAFDKIKILYLFILFFWHDNAYWATEPDGKLKFSMFRNPIWRMAAILKIENRPYRRNCSTDLREIWHNDAYWASKPDRKFGVGDSKNINGKNGRVYHQM